MFGESRCVPVRQAIVHPKMFGSATRWRAALDVGRGSQTIGRWLKGGHQRPDGDRPSQATSRDALARDEGSASSRKEPVGKDQRSKARARTQRNKHMCGGKVRIAPLAYDPRGISKPPPDHMSRVGSLCVLPVLAFAVLAHKALYEMKAGCLRLGQGIASCRLRWPISIWPLMAPLLAIYLIV